MKKVFIHIPKNAGSAIKSFYSNKVLNTKHCIDQKYKKELDQVFTGEEGLSPNYTHCRWRDLSDIYKKYTSFAIIRNPWDRIVSRYTFREIIRKKRGIFKPKSFEEFIDERYMYDNKEYYWHRAVDGWYQQLEHVIDDNKILKCDIIRYEMLDIDIGKYLNISGKVKWKNVSNGDMHSKRLNVSKRKDYKSFYNKETIDIIAEWYKDDIEFFGFSFDGTATKNIWNNK